MKFTAKQLTKLSTKHEKEMNKEKKKIKDMVMASSRQTERRISSPTRVLL